MYTLVHHGHGVSSHDCNCIATAVINTFAKFLVLVWLNDDEEGPFWLDRLNDIQFEHFLLSAFSTARVSALHDTGHSRAILRLDQ